MLFNSLSFAIFLPLAFVACGLTTYTPQGYRGVRPDSAPIAFGAFDRLDSFEIPTATSLSLLGFAAVASCLDLGCLPRRGVEIVERARLGEITQSSNLGYGDGLLRRMGDAARSQTFYTFSPSTRLNKNGLGGLPCRGGEGGENARLGRMLQSPNLETGAWVRQFHRQGDASWSQTFYTFSPSGTTTPRADPRRRQSLAMR